MSFLVEPVRRLKGEVILSGDKSIAHRCVIISAISDSPTVIENFPANKDCLFTVKAFKKLGIKITRKSEGVITVYGKGMYGLTKPDEPIFVGDSGTTLRLLLGLLAGQSFEVKLTGGESLSTRPMLRVTVPLRRMGAKIEAQTLVADGRGEEHPPITIKGGNLKPVIYRMPIASAQVKSAILLAGLYAKGLTQVIEPIRTRDHTERMLKLFGADIKVKENKIVIRGNRGLFSPSRIYIPGDISSASFFVVLATILPDSQILVRNVGLNPLRMGIIKVLRRMGADIEIQNYRLPGSRPKSSEVKDYEPIGDLFVKSSPLRGTIVKKEEIPSLIDELPILMVAACNAKGRTIFEGVEELRVKETDRIRSMSENLMRMGADIRVIKGAGSEKIAIQCARELRGSQVRSYTDHRTAMSMVIAGLAAKGKTIIDDISCINKSFPDFLSILKTLIQ